MIIHITYIFAAILFILGLKNLSKVRTARFGNFLAALGMLIAVGITLLDQGVLNYQWILIGVIIGSLIGILFSYFVQMTAMPQLVAVFNGFGGLASALVACSELLRVGYSMTTFVLITVMLSTFIGTLTLTGSFIAFGKLQGIVKQQPVTYFLQKTINLLIFLLLTVLAGWYVYDSSSINIYWFVAAFSALLGITLVLPIGGADMPVVISLLNSYSGIAAAMTGFVLMNNVLIVAGSLVGAAGLILTQIMCKAMNRSLVNVAFATFGKVETDDSGKAKGQEYTNVKSCGAEEVAMMMDGAQSVIIVPGYGMAVARAQHVVRELEKYLEERGVSVKYAIHPVAGRMPGHMNVLLAEADVPYDKLYEMDRINSEFEQADVALVIGANDVTNPEAREDKGSPIYGMPILNVDKAKSVVVIKRSLSPGFAGIKNPLFENEKTYLFYSDAKTALEEIGKEIKEI